MPGSPLARTSGGRVALFMRGIPNTNRLTYTPAEFLHFSLDLVGRMCTGVATVRRLSTVISMRCVSIFIRWNLEFPSKGVHVYRNSTEPKEVVE